MAQTTLVRKIKKGLRRTHQSPPSNYIGGITLDTPFFTLARLRYYPAIWRSSDSYQQRDNQ